MLSVSVEDVAPDGTVSRLTGGWQVVSLRQLDTSRSRSLDGEAVHRGLRAIPEDFAAAVELHDIDGFKYVEIAEIVGVPIGTVMSRIARGRKLLAGAIMAERGGVAADARTTERRTAQGGPR